MTRLPLPNTRLVTFSRNVLSIIRTSLLASFFMLSVGFAQSSPSTSLLSTTSQPNSFFQKFQVDSLQTTLGASGDSMESANVKARIFSTDLGLKLRDEIYPNVNVQAWILGNFETGTNQAAGTLQPEYEPNQAINLIEGYVSWVPAEWAKLSFGSHWQNDYNSPLLVWNTPFLSARQKIMKNGFYFQAQQAIPNNNILARRLGNVEQGTATYFIETLGYETQETDYQVHLQLSHFSFQELSAETARVSGTFGNSVVGAAEASRFLYNFRGTNFSAQTKFYIHESWFASLNGQYLFNDQAPNGRNEGRLIDVGIGKDIWAFRLGHFRNESDTAPGFYNARMYNHNNMEGQMVSVTSQNTDTQFRLSLITGKPIDDNLLQNKFTLVNFMLVRTYDI